jgi:hypothetical protein
MGLGHGEYFHGRSPPQASRPVLGPTQPRIQWVPGAVYPGIKRQGHKADHSPPSRASGVIPLLPHVFMAWCLIK